MQIVWFKRDLRVHDNAALAGALSYGPVVPLYIFEPELWQQPDLSWRQFAFLKDSLAELDQALTQLGQPLIIRVGDAVKVLEEVRKAVSAQSLWSHQETWNHWTFERDLRVKAWAQSKTLNWFEPPQHGIVRRLPNRDVWAQKWHQHMYSPQLPRPVQLPKLDLDTEPLPESESLGLSFDGCEQRQIGGRARGLRALSTFLNVRGEHYTRAMSSPEPAFQACSRISPHLAFGTLSVREAFQTAEAKQRALGEISKSERGRWPRAVRSFSSRLRWHCHFMQKLEDAPRIEFENMHSAYRTLRVDSFDETRFAAWKDGKTGYPLVDACMRSLNATGWLTFRMRSMLMSFASYHLWLPWQPTALHLAQQFTDYEPGIHYCQAQMQSGTTGINAIRIYNPIKQSQDQDPEGTFIRRWVPELATIPLAFIHEPWRCPADLWPEKSTYPEPIVDEKAARGFAADQLYSVRKSRKHRAEAKAVFDKLGSRRKRNSHNKKPKASTKTMSKQGELPL